MISENVGNVLIFREKVLDLRPKSVCAVEMTMYVQWTCIIEIEKIIMLDDFSSNKYVFKNINGCVAQF